MSQFFSEQALDPEFTLAFCFSERGPKELRGRSAMYLGALSDEQAAERGPVVKAERPWQRPSGAACANGAVDMEHGFEIENVGRRGPLSTAVTWADGPSVCFEF